MLNELIDAGRSLLRAQPMDRDACFRWSDDARAKLADCYGPKSPKTLEFVKARWEISTSHESDPSIYLTQVGANVRRELRVLEKFLRQEGGTSRSEPARPSPQLSRAPERAPVERKVLILGGADPSYADRAAAVVGRVRLSAAPVSAKDREMVASVRARSSAPGVAGAILVLDPDPSVGGAEPRPRVEAALELGVLLGVLGPERVIVLADARLALPAAAGTRRITLDDPASLESRLQKALESLPA